MQCNPYLYRRIAYIKVTVISSDHNYMNSLVIVELTMADSTFHRTYSSIISY